MKSLILVAFLLWHQQGLALSPAAVEGDDQECIEDTDEDTTSTSTKTCTSTSVPPEAKTDHHQVQNNTQNEHQEGILEDRYPNCERLASLGDCR